MLEAGLVISRFLHDSAVLALFGIMLIVALLGTMQPAADMQ